MNQIIASDNESSKGGLLTILLRVSLIISAVSAVMLPLFREYSLPLGILSIGLILSWLVVRLLRAHTNAMVASAVLLITASFALSISRVTVRDDTAVFFAAMFLLFIPLAGLIFGRTGTWVAVVISLVLMWSDTLYRLQADSTNGQTITITSALFTIMFWVCGLLVNVSADTVERALKRSFDSEQTLALRNIDLEHEITVRQNAEGQLRTSEARARAMLDAVDELLTCDTLDDIWRRAVELAREKLEIERCSIFLLSEDSCWLFGTFGTDLKGNTTDERAVKLEVTSKYWQTTLAPSDTIASMASKVPNYWGIRPDSRTTEWRDGKFVELGTGWVAYTPLRTRSGRVTGILFNDAYRSGNRPDYALQDALAVYCAQVSNIAETKRLEQALKDSNAELEERVQERTEQLELERDHLEARVAERTRELFKLIDASRMFAITLELRPLLKLILSKMREVIAFDGCAIGVLRDSNAMEIVYFDGAPQTDRSNRWPTDTARDSLLHAVLVNRQFVLMPDTQDESEFSINFRAGHMGAFGHALSARSAIYVPLMLGDRVLGVLALLHMQRGYYTESHASLAMGFAAYIGIALENARLYQTAVRAATNAERSRLARELHDSVSQALYGITLGTRTAMEYAARQKGNPIEPMQFVLNLAEGALAEMRALIFELRPESLAQEGLIGAFRKQANSLVARHGLNLSMDLGEAEPDLSIERKEALYRITLEAIQNTLKHSGASQVLLRMHCDTQNVTVEVRDNGRGFATDADYPGHYGLHTMRERAQRYGGSLHINSTLGQGTTITASLPLIGEQSEMPLMDQVLSAA